MTTDTRTPTRSIRRVNAIHKGATAICGALLSIALLSGCEKPAAQSAGPGGGAGAGGGRGVGPPQQRDPVNVSLTKVRTMPTDRFVEVIGTLQGDEDVTVSAKVSGRVTSIYKDLGDAAEPGELLAEIDKTDYQLVVAQKELAVREALAKLGLTDMPSSGFDAAQTPSVQRAKLQADNAEAKFQRGRQLHEQVPPLISDQDFADFQTAAAVARSNYDVELLTARALIVEASARQADLDIARQSLTDTVVAVPVSRKFTTTIQTSRAPGANPTTVPTVGGGDNYILAERMISTGEYIKDGTPLFRLLDVDPIKLRATAPEKHVGRVKLGQPASIHVEAYPEPFVGHVSRMNPQIDPASRTFQVEILVANPEHQLKPGGFAQARINTHQDPNVVFVPQSSVLTFAGVSKVFTIKDGKAAEILVELGQRRGDVIEVVKGLKGNEQIVADNLNRLANGVPVKVSGATAATTQPAESATAVGG